MKPSHLLTIAATLLIATSVHAAAPIYYGQSLKANKDYVRTQVGTTQKSIVKEVSGLACSRVTPGYLWAEWDEGCSNILALRPDGTKQMRLTLRGMNQRDDWEDICTGTYNNTPYIFIGAFGDNQLVFADQYYIVCVAEPAITSVDRTVDVLLIRFGFPDHLAHNVETLMYDPIYQTFYIVDKAESVAPTLYSLPMSTTYGNALQTLTRVRQLGLDADGWDLVTGGDISPDGSLVAIKNQKHILLWTRQGTESLTATMARTPKYISTYKKEEQGESLAWLDNNSFYTTSDSKNDTPIYVYSKAGAVIPPLPTDTTGGSDQPTETALEAEPEPTTPRAEKYIRDGHLYIRHGEQIYTILGTR